MTEAESKAIDRVELARARLIMNHAMLQFVYLDSRAPEAVKDSAHKNLADADIDFVMAMLDWRHIQETEAATAERSAAEVH